MATTLKLSRKFCERVNFDPDTISQVFAKAQEIYAMPKQRAIDEIMAMLVNYYFDKENEQEGLDFAASLKEVCKVRRQKNDGFDVPTGNEKWFKIPEFKQLFSIINDNGKNEFGALDAYLIFTTIRDYIKSKPALLIKTEYVMQGILNGSYSWLCEEGEEYSKAERSFHGMLCEICGQKKEKVNYIKEWFCSEEDHIFEKAFAKMFIYIREHIEDFSDEEEEAEQENPSAEENTATTENAVAASEKIIPQNTESSAVIEQNAQIHTGKLTPYQIAANYKEINSLFNYLNSLEVATKAVEAAKTELLNAGINPDEVIASREKITTFIKAIAEYQDE